MGKYLCNSLTTFVLRIFLVLSFLASLCHGATYKPGEPGAPWTKQEMLTIKAKLYTLFMQDGGSNAVDEFRIIKKLKAKNVLKGRKNSRVPDAPKMLRLSFHDCLKYKDGTGGCDGCLNVNEYYIEKSGDKYLSEARRKKRKDIKESDNNGLELTVRILEEMYTNKTFPEVTMKLFSVSTKIPSNMLF